MQHKPQKTSQILIDIVDECEEDGTVTVGEFLDKMGRRAQAMAILVFSLSAVVAGVIPGFSTLMAVPIMFMALQMAVGRRSVYLPRNIYDKQVSPRVIRGALARAIPTLRKVEKFLKPRLPWLTHPIVERLVALIICMLAGILALPIPGGNFLPSIGISILALAMIERDGVLVLAAVGLVFLTGGVMIDLTVQAFHYASNLIQWMF